MLFYSKNIAQIYVVTEKNIAKGYCWSCSVSTALVSFVLNGKRKEYRVGEETAQRILKIANDMNYQRILRQKVSEVVKRRRIGLVVSDISNPFSPSCACVGGWSRQTKLHCAFWKFGWKTRIKWIVLLVTLLIKV